MGTAGTRSYDGQSLRRAERYAEALSLLSGRMRRGCDSFVIGRNAGPVATDVVYDERRRQIGVLPRAMLRTWVSRGWVIDGGAGERGRTFSIAPKGWDVIRGARSKAS